MTKEPAANLAAVEFGVEVANWMNARLTQENGVFAMDACAGVVASVMTALDLTPEEASRFCVRVAAMGKGVWESGALAEQEDGATDE